MKFTNKQNRRKRRVRFSQWLRNLICSSLFKVAIASFLYLFLKSEDLEAWKTAYEIVDFIF